jgi:hypothetical protein
VRSASSSRRLGANRRQPAASRPQIGGPPRGGKQPQLAAILCAPAALEPASSHQHAMPLCAPACHAPLCTRHAIPLCAHSLVIAAPPTAPFSRLILLYLSVWHLGGGAPLTRPPAAARCPPQPAPPDGLSPSPRVTWGHLWRRILALCLHLVFLLRPLPLCCARWAEPRACNTHLNCSPYSHPLFLTHQSNHRVSSITHRST